MVQAGDAVRVVASQSERVYGRQTKILVHFRHHGGLSMVKGKRKYYAMIKCMASVNVLGLVSEWHRGCAIADDRERCRISASAYTSRFQLS